MKNLGWSSKFLERDWAEVRTFLSGILWTHGEGAYLLDIIDSVLDHGADAVLAVTTSMHDLLVAPKPVGGPHAIDVVIVRAPGSLRPAERRGHVRIEHRSVNGHDTVVERPPGEAVNLFWRFVEAEFGLRRRDPR
ncbi:MAG TPA: hypothetical protein VF230_17055 [Acidimicrobiales bacterium]